MEEQNPVLEKTNKFPLWLITVTPLSKVLAMILFITLPFVGFYLGMQYQQKVTVAPVASEVQKAVIPTLTPTQVATPPPTSASTDVSTWKTYKNTQYGFQFSYPSNIGTECKVDSNYCSINKISSLPGGIDTNFIWFTVVPANIKDRTYQNSSLYNFQITDELLTMSLNEQKVIPSSNSNLSKGFTYQRLNDISVNGQTAKVFVNNSPWEFPGGTLEKRIVINYKNYLYTIGSYTGDYISLEIFDQIISTLKFTN